MRFLKKSKAVLISALMAGLLSFQSLALSGVVTSSSSLNMRQEPATDAAIIASIGAGAKVDILSKIDNWYNITYNGSTGYVSADYVKTEQTVATVKASGGLNFRAAAKSSAAKLDTIPNGAKVEILSDANGWSNILYNNINGYVSSKYLVTGEIASRSSVERTGDQTSTAEALLDYAKKYLGVPYVYGGASARGFDCSGFTQFVYAHFGYKLPRTATAQAASSLCVSVAKADLIPGDLVFFKLPSSSKKIGHVGIYVGGGKFIHASSPGDDVKYDSLSSSYYSRNYVTARRIIQ